ncbi:hypothetical protein ACP4OV_017655 [Aristida adscensionis]
MELYYKGFEGDAVLIPWVTAWFGCYSDGAVILVLCAREDFEKSGYKFPLDNI